MPDRTLSARAGSLSSASMRYHELALVRWLNQWALVREGYPVPVVFSNPMDAFSHFAQLWSSANNPYKYLLDLKDEAGTPLYEPHPSPARYPIISVHRRGWKYRPGQNYSIHRWRHVNWPTTSDEGPTVPGKVQIGTQVYRADLGEVLTARRPMAWDYRFQIDHFCTRPDTQAFFIDQLMDQLWRAGGNPQTWLVVDFPGYGAMQVRLALEGDIENMTPDEAQTDKSMEFRTSINVVVEGYHVDTKFESYPALWTMTVNSVGSGTTVVDAAFHEDLRRYGANLTLDSRSNVPAREPSTMWSSGTYARGA